jgi:hypothetical protein
MLVGFEHGLITAAWFTASPALEAIAACESGGNPAHASEAEQDRRASILYARAGASPWPMCGR